MKSLNQVLLPGDPTAPSGATTKQYIDLRAVPAGGTTGYVLSKNSSSDWDVVWAPSSGGSGGISALRSAPDYDDSVAPTNNQAMAWSSASNKYHPLTMTPAIIGSPPTSRQVIAGTGLSGGGDLSADRTLAVAYGTAAGTAAQGNDTRLSDARTPTAHTHSRTDVTNLATVAGSGQYSDLTGAPAVAIRHVGNAFMVLQADAAADLTTAASYGATHGLVVAYWDRLQSAAGAAVDASSVITNINNVLAAGMQVCLRVVIASPPAWVRAGAIPPLKNEAGAIWDPDVTTGYLVKDWYWGKVGRDYVADFYNKLFAQLPWGVIDRVQVGGGPTGELQFPNNPGSGMWWAYSDAAQGNAALAPGMDCAPTAGYVPSTGTTWTSDDTNFATWYTQSLTNWMLWQIEKHREWFRGPIWVLHPGSGLRPISQTPTGTNAAIYRQNVANGHDWDHQIGAYPPDVHPYSTWVDSQHFWTPDPYNETYDANAAPWYHLLRVAKKHGRAGRIWGENTGGQTTADMQRTFRKGAGAFGFEGIAWLSHSSLVTGGTSNASYADYQALIAAAGSHGGRPVLNVDGTYSPGAGSIADVNVSPSAAIALSKIAETTSLKILTASERTLIAGAVQSTRQVISGTGLSGGGDLSADRTLAVSYGSAAGTAVQGNDTRVTADQAPGTASIRTLGTGAQQAAAGNDSRITGAVQSSRQVLAGTGLTGGGALSADVTLGVSFGTAAGTVTQGNDTRVVNAVQTTRQVLAGTGLTGGGTLAADRTFAVSYGTAAGTSAQGNDSRIVGAEQTANKGVASGYPSLDATVHIPNTQMPIVPTPIRSGSVTSALTSDASTGSGNYLNIQLNGDATINAPTNAVDWQTFEWHFVATGAARNLTFGGGFVRGGAELGPYAVPRGAVAIAKGHYVGNRANASDQASQAWALTSVTITDQAYPLAAIGAAASARQIIAGTGLTGGGDLTADRTLAVAYGTTANTAAQGNDSRITGAVQSTRQVLAGTGLTGGGALSSDVTLTVAYGTAAGTAAQGNDTRITGAVQNTRQVIAGTGLSGGGALSADVTLALTYSATTPGAVASAGAVGTATTVARSDHVHPGVPTARQVISGTGLTGGGDLSADRTLAVSYGTTAGTALQGNDPSVTNARTPTAHASTHASAGSDPITPQSIGAAVGTSPVSVNSNTTASFGMLYLVDASGGPITITFPVITTNGQRIAVKKIDSSANVVTVAAGSGNTIGSAGAASVPIRLQDQAATYQAFGTNWVIPHGYLGLPSLDVRYLASSLFTTKGDLLLGTGAAAVARQAVGTDGYVLTADSTQTNGVKWAAAASAGGVQTGDVRLAFPQQAEAHAPVITKTRTAMITRATTPLDILCIGDSITEGMGQTLLANRWVPQLQSLLRTQFPIAGVAGGQGYIPAVNLSTSFANGWTYAGVYSTNGTFGLGHRTCVLSSGSPGGSITRTVSGTSITVAFTTSTSTGSFQVFLDGSGTAAVTVNTASGATSTAHDNGRTTVSLGTRGSHTVKIAWSSGSDVYVNGIFVYDQDESVGVRVTESGQHGSKSADWSPAATATAYCLDDDMGLLQPDLVIIELGVNDMIGGVTPATYKTNLLDIISHVKSAVTPTTPDILLLAAYDIGQNAYAYPWQSYVGIMRQIEAADTAVSLLDLSAVMPRSNETDYGVIYTDGVHPNDNGANLIARNVRDYITQMFPGSARYGPTASPMLDSWWVTADTYPRLGIWPDGYMRWGSGAAAGDVELYRIQAGRLYCNQQFKAINGVIVSYTTQSANYTLVDADEVVLVNTTSGSLTMTLPTAVGRGGKRYTIKKIAGTNTNTVTIATTSAQTIDGNTTEVIQLSGSFRELVSDGANWHIVATKAEPAIISLAAVAAAGTISIDASTGNLYRVTASGATVTLGVPSNGVDGATITVEVLCSVACTITVNASILLAGGASATITMAAGKRWFATLRNVSGVGWFMLGNAAQA